MDIYEKIWLSDQNGNGIKPLLSSSKERPKTGYVLVDEKGAHGKGTNPLLTEVSIPPEKRKTYQLVTALFDKYEVDESRKEVPLAEKTTERDALINEIADKEPMKIARDYVEKSSGHTFTLEGWKKELVNIWFREFDTSNGRNLSGFEHVVIGEAKGKIVDGYHFWYKYFLDDSPNNFTGQDEITYLRGYDTIPVPESACISFEWDSFDMAQGKKITETKKKGGFFIGCSIEGLMAMGTVRFRGGDSSATINGHGYKLLCFPSGDKRSLRTFYPSLNEPQVESPSSPKTPSTPSTPSTPLTPSQSNNSIRIISALINPSDKGTTEAGRELITFFNPTENKFNLKGWTLASSEGSTEGIDREFEISPHSTRTLVTGLYLIGTSGKISLMDKRKKYNLYC